MYFFNERGNQVLVWIRSWLGVWFIQHVLQQAEAAKQLEHELPAIHSPSLGIRSRCIATKWCARTTGNAAKRFVLPPHLPAAAPVNTSSIFMHILMAVGGRVVGGEGGGAAGGGRRASQSSLTLRAATEA